MPLQLFKIDVEMQGFCQSYAAEFNKRRPPKPVMFLDAFLICLKDRPGQPLYACEPMIKGDFIKHNNNAGQVHEVFSPSLSPASLNCELGLLTTSFRPDRNRYKYCR